MLKLKSTAKAEQPKNSTDELLKQLAPLRREFMSSAVSCKKSNAYLGSVHYQGARLSLKVQGTGPCHGGWQANRQHLESPVYAFSAVQEEARNPDIERDFYTFLANESCFKDCFISKDYADILENGWVFDCSQPANVVGNAAIATRFYTEHYSQSLKARHPIYLALREAGLSVWESYFFCHVFTPSNTKKPFPCSAVPYTSGHTIFQMANRTKESYRNMISGTFDQSQVSKTSFKDQCGYIYGTLDSLWGEHDREGNNRYLSLLTKYKPRVETRKVNLNIFEKKPSAGISIPKEADLLSVIEQIKEGLQ